VIRFVVTSTKSLLPPADGLFYFQSSVYGTSHIISLQESKYIYQDGAERLIIGAGLQGMVSLSDEAVDYFKKKKCKIDLHPTPKAIEKWNDATEAVIGLFHITC
jgi:hypothetical protein